MEPNADLLAALAAADDALAALDADAAKLRWINSVNLEMQKVCRDETSQCE